jgi:UDP:flavonoid glycosyltransferase YjiC (YdhE family)
MHRLEKAGHQVTCACPKDVGDKVRIQGFAYEQLVAVNYEPAPDLPPFKENFRKVKRLLHKWMNRRKRQKEAIAALGMDDFEGKMRELKPDLLIIDVELHEHIMTTVAQKMPVLLLSQWFSLWEREGLPPLLHDTIPGVGEAGSPAAIKQAWQKIKRKRRRIFLKKKIRSGATNRRTILQKYAAQIGFPKEYISENFWPGPFTYSKLPVINMTAEELEFPHELRPHSFYVGPMVFARRKEAHSNAEVEAKLEQIFSDCATQNKKLIYCSVSTYRKGDTSFIEKLGDAVRDKKEWTVIVGLGGMLDADSLQNLPKNVHPFKWIPQLKVLEKVDLSINHGGIHTINECLHFRVPMLIYSGKRSDQNGCAARIHYHQAGIMADKDIDNSSDIRRKIELVLSDKRYLEKINEVQTKVENARENRVMEKWVERFIKGR